MARFVRKLGTQSKRFLFEMTIHQVDIAVPYEVHVGAIFRRGEKRQQTRIEPIVNKESGCADFKDEKLAILSSLFADTSTGLLQDRVVRTFHFLANLITTFIGKHNNTTPTRRNGKERGSSQNQPSRLR